MELSYIIVALLVLAAISLSINLTSTRRAFGQLEKELNRLDDEIRNIETYVYGELDKMKSEIYNLKK